MILVTIKIDVLTAKQKELSQTLYGLAGRVQKEAGCVGSRFYRDVENGNTLCVLEEWVSQADLDAHLRSHNFSVLRGAVKLLSGSAEMQFYSENDERSWGSCRHGAI